MKQLLNFLLEIIYEIEDALTPFLVVWAAPLEKQKKHNVEAYDPDRKVEKRIILRITPRFTSHPLVGA
jgi:hypothetical protein